MPGIRKCAMNKGIGRIFATCTLMALLMLNGFLLVWTWSWYPIQMSFLIFINTLVAIVIAVNHVAYRYFLEKSKGLYWSAGKILLFVIHSTALFLSLLNAVGMKDPTSFIFLLLVWIATVICFVTPLSIMGERVTRPIRHAFPEQRIISAYHTVATCGTLVVLIGTIGSGGPEGFLNIPVIIATYGITCFILLGIFKQDFIRFIPDSFASLISQPLTSSPRFADIAATGARVCVGAGAITTLIGFVQMLRNLDTPSAIGVGLSMLILPALYSIVAAELYFFFLQKIYTEEPHSKMISDTLPLRNLALPLIVIMLILIFTFILLTAFCRAS